MSERTPAPVPSLVDAFSRRRAILGAVTFAAAPKAVLPALAAPSAIENASAKLASASPDSELLAIGREWAASAEREDELFLVFDEAQDRYNAAAPTTPEALFAAPRDARYFFPLRSNLHLPTGRFWHSPSKVRQLRDLRNSVLGRDLPALARRDEIIAAHDAYEAECQAVRDACGLTAADAACDAEIAINRDLRRRIVEMRAVTFEGVMLKARVVSWCTRGVSDLEEELAETTGASNDTLQLSIARDLVAMVDAAVSI